MEIYYHQHVFTFEPDADESFAGRLILDNVQSVLLASLLDAEYECWYLDADGQRLPDEELFGRSPWSCNGPDGPIKLLCRLIDLRDGSVRFNTPESYLGELFRWLR
jgi:hypothetical protein